MKVVPIIIVLLASCGCRPQVHVTTIENKQSEAVKIYIDGDLQQPVIEAHTTTRLSEKVFAQRSVGIVAKSAKDGTELWKKDYEGQEMDEIREGDELHFVIPASH
jgi:hypothetical protein